METLLGHMRYIHIFTEGTKHWRREIYYNLFYQVGHLFGKFWSYNFMVKKLLYIHNKLSEYSLPPPWPKARALSRGHHFSFSSPSRGSLICHTPGIIEPQWDQGVSLLPLLHCFPVLNFWPFPLILTIFLCTPATASNYNDFNIYLKESPNMWTLSSQTFWFPKAFLTLEFSHCLPLYLP